MQGCVTILGLRDVLDAPDLLEEEWKKKEIMQKIAGLYDDVWIYGPENFWTPLQGQEVPPRVKKMARYTGFLQRENSRN